MGLFTLALALLFFPTLLMREEFLSESELPALSGAIDFSRMGISREEAIRQLFSFLRVCGGRFLSFARSMGLGGRVKRPKFPLGRKVEVLPK